MFNPNRQQGFTLVELLTVVIILGVLATIAYPTYQQYVRKTRMENARADLIENVRKLEDFYNKNNSFSGFKSTDLIQTRSNDYFTLTLDATDNDYKITAKPTTKNKKEKQSAVYYSLEGMFLCTDDEDIDDKPCTPF